MKKLLALLMLIVLLVPMAQGIYTEIQEDGEQVFIVTSDDALTPLNTFLSQNSKPSIWSLNQYIFYLNYLAALKEIEKPPYAVSDTLTRTSCGQSDFFQSGMTTFVWSGDDLDANRATYRVSANDRYVKIYSMRTTGGASASIFEYTTLNGPKTLGPADGSKGPNTFSDKCPKGYHCRFLLSEWKPCNLAGQGSNGGVTCGNGICEAGETPTTCPMDCKAPPVYRCGNLVCEPGENPQNCPTDCREEYIIHYEKKCKANSLYWYDNKGNPTDFIKMCEFGCENGVCKGITPPVCGNYICEPGETPESCPTDCKAPPVCGDGICESGETAATCPADCGGDVEWGIIAAIAAGIIAFFTFIVWISRRK